MPDDDPKDLHGAAVDAAAERSIEGRLDRFRSPASQVRVIWSPPEYANDPTALKVGDTLDPDVRMPPSPEETARAEAYVRSKEPQ